MVSTPWLLLAADKLPPVRWGTLAADIRRALPEAVVAHTGDELIVGCDVVGGDAVHVGVARALVAADLVDTVQVVHLDETPAQPLPCMPSTRRAGVGSLAAAAVLAALSDASAAHAEVYTTAAIHQAGALTLITRMSALLRELANIAAVDGVPTDAESLATLAESRHRVGEWLLLLPGVSEAVAAGVPGGAFDAGETICVPIVVATQVELAAALVCAVAKQRGEQPLLTGAKLLFGV